MTLAIISLLTALLPTLLGLVAEYVKHKQTPLTPSDIHTQNEQEINKVIATGDERDANVLLDDMLKRVQQSEVRSHFGGQNDKEG